MIGGAHLIKSISLSLGRISMISLMGLVLISSQALGFIARNESLNPERVNNRKPLAIVTSIVTVCSTRRQDIPSAGTSLVLLISIMHLTLPIQIRTWAEFQLNIMLLSISSTRLIIKFTKMESLKKQNNVLFKLGKKSSSHRDLNKIKNINKSGYDYILSNDIRISRDSESS